VTSEPPPTTMKTPAVQPRSRLCTSASVLAALILVAACGPLAPSRVPEYLTAPTVPPTAAGAAGDPSHPDPSTSTLPRAATPALAYYVGEDPGGSSLVEWRLDGTSRPRPIVRLAAPTADDQITFEVHPTGLWAVASTYAEDAGRSRLDAIELSTGRTLALGQAPGATYRSTVWAEGGPVFASMYERDHGQQIARVLIVGDLRAQHLRTIAVPPHSHPFSVGADGSVVLLERISDAQGRGRGWRVSRVTAEGRLEPVGDADLATLPRPSGLSPVSLVTGRAVEPFIGAEGSGMRLQVTDLEGRDAVVVHRSPHEYTSTGFTPDGTRIVAVEGLPDRNGERQAAVLWLDPSVPDPAGAAIARGPLGFDLASSPDGRLLVTETWRHGRSELRVIDPMSRNVLRLPVESRIASVVRVVSGELPVALPDMSVTVPGTTPVPGAPTLLASTVDQDRDGRVTAQLSVVTPGEDAVVVLHRSPPLPVPLGVARDALYLDAVPRPGTDEVLVSIGDERRTQLLLWTPGADLVPLALPEGWPRFSSLGPRWRPDGQALAVHTDARAGPGWDDDDVVWFELDRRVLHRLTLHPDADRLEGWSGDGRWLIASYPSCEEACAARYAFYGRVDPFTGGYHPNGVGERTGAISRDPELNLDAGYWVIGRVSREIALSSIVGDAADDVTLVLPAELTEDGLGERTLWSRDGRWLYLTHQRGEVRRLYAVEMPLDRQGRVEVTPRLVGSLPVTVTLEAVDGMEGWALIREQRTFDSGVVQLSTGRVFPIQDLGLLEFLPSEPPP
jgi:hypothetical protein